MQYFDNTSDLLKYTNQPPAKSPQWYVLSIDIQQDILKSVSKSSPLITTGFCGISLKKIIEGQMACDRTKYDFDKKAMIFTALRQVVQWNQVFVLNSNFSMYFHESFIKKRYWEKEENTLIFIFRNSAQEYHNNQDKFSKGIIIAFLATLLKYIHRFYGQQLINRASLNARFKNILRECLESNQLKPQDIPVPNALRVETVSELGFISSPYFSDIFKQKTGISSSQCIVQYSLS